MIFISTIINAIPPGTRDLVEFSFFLAVGVTAGSLGLLSWIQFKFYQCFWWSYQERLWWQHSSLWWWIQWKHRSMGLVTNTSMILGEVVLAFAVFLFMMYNMRD